jgi:hypothetical protein
MNEEKPAKKPIKIDKIYLIFSALFALLSSLVVTLFACFGFDATAYDKKCQIAAEAYQSIQSDYIVPGLSNEQIAEVSKRDDVKAILPYFAFSGSVSFGGKTFDKKVYFLDNFDHSDLTAYLPGRVFQEGGNGTRKIYVDFPFLVQSGCHLGDNLDIQIGSSKLTYQVGLIAPENYLDGGGTLHALIDDEVKNALYKAFFQYGDFQYSDTYVDCSDKTAFYSYIKDYKPEATRLPRAAFSSDGDYDIYTYNFDHKDFSGGIIEVAPLLTQKAGMVQETGDQYAKESRNVAFAMAGSLIGVALVWAVVAFLYLRKVSTSSSVAKPYLWINGICAGASLVVSVVVFLVASSQFSETYHLSFSILLSCFAPAFVAALLSEVIAVVALEIVAYKTIKRA